MFQRKSAALHHKTNGQASVAEPADVDRRIWIRYPCDMSTVCQSIAETAELRLAARVRNISRGGVTLLSSRAFTIGSLLSVELPGAEGSTNYSVLAYVLRVTTQTDGQCLVSCQFASELSDEDLQPFATKHLKPMPPDPRSWVRFPCTSPIAFREVGTAREEDEKAAAVDLSPRGIGLITRHPLEVGTLLQLELGESEGEPVVSILATVVRLAETGPNEWSVGCNFIRDLTEEELRQIG